VEALQILHIDSQDGGRETVIGRKSPALRTGYTIDNFDTVAERYTKYTQSNSEWTNKQQSQSITILSPPQDLPLKTFKMFCDWSHLTWSHLSSGSYKSLPSRRWPRNLTAGANNRALSLWNALRGRCTLRNHVKCMHQVFAVEKDNLFCRAHSNKQLIAI